MKSITLLCLCFANFLLGQCQDYPAYQWDIGNIQDTVNIESTGDTMKTDQIGEIYHTQDEDENYFPNIHWQENEPVSLQKFSSAFFPSFHQKINNQEFIKNEYNDYLPTPPPPARNEYFFAYAAEKRRKAEKYLIDNFVPKAPEVSTKKSVWDYNSVKNNPSDYSSVKPIISAIQGHNKPLSDFLYNNGLFPLYISSTPSVDINSPIVEDPNQSDDIIYFENDETTGFENIYGIIGISNNNGSGISEDADFTTLPNPINILSVENNYSRNNIQSSDVSGISDPIVKYVKKNEEYEASDSNLVEIQFSNEILKNTIKKITISDDKESEPNDEFLLGVQKSNDPHEKQMDSLTTTDITPSFTITSINLSDFTTNSRVDSTTLYAEEERSTEMPSESVLQQNIGSYNDNNEATRELSTVYGDKISGPAVSISNTSLFQIMTTTNRPKQFLLDIDDVERTIPLSDSNTELSESSTDLPEEVEAIRNKSNGSSSTSIKDIPRLVQTPSTTTRNKFDDNLILISDTNTRPSETTKDQFESVTSKIVIPADIDPNLRSVGLSSKNSDSTPKVTALSPSFNTSSLERDFQIVSSQIVKNEDILKHFEATTYIPIFRDVNASDPDITEEGGSLKTSSKNNVLIREDYLKTIDNTYDVEEFASTKPYVVFSRNNSNKTGDHEAVLSKSFENSSNMQAFNIKTDKSDSGNYDFEVTIPNSLSMTSESHSTDTNMLEELKLLEFLKGSGSNVEVTTLNFRPSTDANKEEQSKSMDYYSGTGNNEGVTSFSSSTDSMEELKSMEYSTETESNVQVTPINSSTNIIKEEDLRSIYSTVSGSSVDVTSFSPSTNDITVEELRLMGYSTGTGSNLEVTSVIPSTDVIKVGETRSTEYSVGTGNNEEVTTNFPSTYINKVEELRLLDYSTGPGRHLEVTTFGPSTESVKLEESMDYSTETGRDVEVTTYNVSSTDTNKVEELRALDYLTATGRYAEGTTFGPSTEAITMEESRSVNYSTATEINAKVRKTIYSISTESDQVEEVRSMNNSMSSGRYTEITTVSPSVDANKMEKLRLVESSMGMGNNAELTTISPSTESDKMGDVRSMYYSTGTESDIEVTTFSSSTEFNKIKELGSLDSSTGKGHIELTAMSPSTESVKVEEGKSTDYSTGMGSHFEVTFSPPIDASKMHEFRSLGSSTGTGSNIELTTFSPSTESVKVEEAKAINYSTGTGSYFEVTTFSPSTEFNNIKELRSLDSSTSKGHIELTTFSLSTESVEVEEANSIDYSTGVDSHLEVTTFSHSTNANKMDVLRSFDSSTGTESNVELTTFTPSAEFFKVEEVRSFDSSTGTESNVELTTFTPSTEFFKVEEVRSMDFSTDTGSYIEVMTFSPSTEAVKLEEFKSIHYSTLPINVVELTTFRPTINAVKGDDLKSTEDSKNILTSDENINSHSTIFINENDVTTTSRPLNSSEFKSIIVSENKMKNEINDEPKYSKTEVKKESNETDKFIDQMESRELIVDYPKTTLPSVTATLEEKEFTLEPTTIIINNVPTTFGEFNSEHKKVNLIEETPKSEVILTEDGELLLNGEIINKNIPYTTQPSLKPIEIDSFIPVTQTFNKNIAESSTELYLDDNEQPKYNHANAADIKRTTNSSDANEVFKNLSRNINMTGLYETTKHSHKINAVDANEKQNKYAIYQTNKTTTTNEPLNTTFDNSLIITERPDITIHQKTDSIDNMQSNIDDAIESLKSITSQEISSRLNNITSNPIEKINFNNQTPLMLIGTENDFETIPEDSEPKATILENNLGDAKSQSKSYRMPKKFDGEEYNLKTFPSDTKHSLMEGQKNNFYRRSDITPEEDSDYAK